MAAPMVWCGGALIRRFVAEGRLCTARLGVQSICASRPTSSSSVKDQKASRSTVVMSTNNNMILCWHPEPDFPYEHSQPMPRNDKEMQQGDSALKVQYIVEERTKYRPDGPNQQELMQIFHTTRHAFDHKPRMKYRKPNPPKYREGI